MVQKTEYGKANPPKGLKLIEDAYFAIIIFLTLALVAKITFKFGNGINILESLIGYCLLIVIYYGIKKTKQWVVLLVLLFSYWGVVRSVLDFLTSYPDIIQLIVSRAVDTAFLCFCCYQIYIFSKKETKEYFGVKGIGIIGI